MRIYRKQIGELYFLEITPDYVVINDEYRGLVVLNHNFELVRSVSLCEGVLVDQAISHGNELLLFCYDQDCAYYVDLADGINHRIELSEYSFDVFSPLYYWSGNDILLFSDRGERLFRFDLSSQTISLIEDMSPFEEKIKRKYFELLHLNILSYDSIAEAVLFVRNERYCIYDMKDKTVRELNISEQKQPDGTKSEYIYFRTEYSCDTIICISERTITLLSGIDKKGSIFPPYELYRFSECKHFRSEKEDCIFAISYDNSDKEAPYLLRYDDYRNVMV